MVTEIRRLRSLGSDPVAETQQSCCDELPRLGRAGRAGNLLRLKTRRID